MRLKDTGLTVADVKAMAQKYQIETYERMDFLADWGEGIYMYDENDQPYLDFYAGIAVNSLGNCNPKVVAAVQEQCATLMQTFNYPYTVPRSSCPRRSARPPAWTRSSIRTPALRPTRL